MVQQRTSFLHLCTPYSYKQQLSQFKEDLPVIGGKDCEAVTRTPKHDETFNIGSISVKALHTPCHTQDSICWYMEDGAEKVVFTGDTLFIGGRTSRISNSSFS